MIKYIILPAPNPRLQLDLPQADRSPEKHKRWTYSFPAGKCETFLCLRKNRTGWSYTTAIWHSLVSLMPCDHCRQEKAVCEQWETEQAESSLNFEASSPTQTVLARYLGGFIRRWILLPSCWAAFILQGPLTYKRKQKEKSVTSQSL